MQVRSDFKVSLKLKDTNGKVRTIGTYDSENVSPEGEEGLVSIPHLQRVSPDGRWLATFDADKMRLDLRALESTEDGEGSVGDRQLVKVAGLEGTIRQFRFLSSIEGFSISTSENLYILPYALDEGARTVEAQPVFDPEQMGEFDVVDTRILPDGMIARTREYIDGDPYWWRGDVHWIQIDDDTVQDVASLVPRHLSATAANVRSKGRIVVALDVFDQDIAEKVGHGEVSELWTFETSPAESPKITETTRCAHDYCNIINWAPGTERLTYGYDWDRLAVANDNGEFEDLTMEFTDGYGGNMHTLWTDDDESHILAATIDGVVLWDADGKEQWTWQHPRGYQVHSAHFEDDGSVVVAAGTQLLRVENGLAKRLLRTRGKYKPRRYDPDSDIYPEWNETSKDSFIDDAIMLPGGAIAFAVVDVEETWEEMEWEEPDWEEMEAMEEAMEEAAANIETTVPSPGGIKGLVDKIHGTPVDLEDPFAVQAPSPEQLLQGKPKAKSKS